MLKIEEMHGYSDALNLKDRWNKIVEEAGLDISLSFDFSASLWNAHLDKKDIILLLAKKDDEIIGIFPIVISRKKAFGIFPITSAGLLSNIFCFHNNFICKADTARCFEAVLEYLYEHYPRLDIFEVVNVSDDSNIFKIPLNIEKKRGLLYKSEEAPYIRITKTWDEYLRTRSYKFRKRIRHEGVGFEKIGKFFFKACFPSEESDFILQMIHEVEKESWKEKANVSIALNEKQEKFYENIFRNSYLNNNILVFFLFYGKECAAFNITAIDKNRAYSLKVAYKTKFSDYSPGFILSRHSLEYFFKKGFSELDRLMGNPPWKQEWATGTRKTFYLQVYNSKFYSRTIFYLKRLALLVNR